MFSTFRHVGGRTGNQIFQYLITKVLQLKYGHRYRCFHEIEDLQKDVFVVTEENISDILSENQDNPYLEILKSKNLLCEGYFQKSEYFVQVREKLLDTLYDENNNDYWIYNDKRVYIKDFLNYRNNYCFQENDVVISLRLDDFIQLPRESSDILPPQFYLNILEKLTFNNLYIVCDKIRWDWEYRYMDFFKKWNPIMIQGDIMHDASVIRDCKFLIHSNSSFCWIMSFFSRDQKKRFIPYTNFYKGQKMYEIEDSDLLFHVKPLLHNEVYNIHV